MMTTAPHIERPETAEHTRAATKPSPQWTLVHAEPGALVYALPGSLPAHPLARRAAGRPGSGWVPAGTVTVPHTDTAEGHPDYARFIGRVGLLAAALGVGAAVVGQSAIASAEPADSSSTSSSASETSTAENPSTETSTTATESASPSQAGSASESPQVTVSSSGGADTSESSAVSDTTATAQTSPSETSTTVSAPGTPEVTVSSSGGAHTSTTETATPTTASASQTAEAPTTTEATEQPAVESTPAPTQAPTPTESATEPAPAPTEPAPQAVMTGSPGRESRSRHYGVPAPTTSSDTTAPRSTVPLRAPSAPSIQPTAEGLLGISGQPRADVASTTTSTPPSSQTLSTAEPGAATPAPVGLVSRVVTTLLSPFNSSAATPAAAQAAQAPVLWGVFAWVRRTLFNSTPTLTYNPTQTTQVDNTITGHVSGMDADGDTLSYTATTPTNGGSVTVAPDGTFTYTVPHSMYHTGGTDTFTVTATDAGSLAHIHGVSGLLNAITFGRFGSAGHTATTTVTLNIAAVNAAPIPGSPAYTLDDVDHSTGTVPGEIHATDPDNDLLTYTVAGGPADGTVTINHTAGTFTYTPTLIARHEAAAESATPDQLADNFDVTVDDGHGGTLTIPVSVAIDPTNAAPALSLVVSDPNSNGTVDVLVTATDPDSDPVTYLVVHDPAVGTLTPTPGGYVYTPSADARHAAAATPGIDTDTFAVRASDLHHGIDTETATVTISPANVAPSGLTQTVNVPTPAGVVTGAVTGTDADRDTLTYSGTTTTTKGSVIVHPDGTFAYTPSSDARHAAAADTASSADKKDSFGVTADDGHGGTATLTVHVDVAPANVAPDNVGVTADPGWGPDGESTGTVTANDADGDLMTYSGSTTTAKGTVTVDPNGRFSYTPTTDARHRASAEGAGTDITQDSFTVTVNDGHGGTADALVTVTISPTNSAPTGTAHPGTPDPTTGVVTGNVIGTDLDGDQMVYSGTTTTAKGSVVVTPNGNFTYTPTTESRHVAAADGATDEDKKDTFDITVTDGHGGTATVPVTVGIGISNRAPTGTAKPGAPDPETGVVTGNVIGTDPDGDQMVYSGTTTTAKGSAVVTPNGNFTYTPTTEARHVAAADGATDDDKKDTFDITVTDGHGGSTSVPVTVAIQPANRAPALSVDVADPDPAKGVVTGGVTGTDPDGDTVTYTLTGNPANGDVVVSPDGSFVYTPTEAARHAASTIGAGPALTQDTFTVTADDGHGGTPDATVTVTISPTNAAPTGAGVIGTADPTTGTVTGAITADDADHDTLTYTVVAPPARGNVVVHPDGSLTYDPTDAARLEAATTPATDGFTVRVDDGHGGTTDVTVANVPVSSAELGVKYTTSMVGKGYGVAFAPDGTPVAYVTNDEGNTVSVINTATNTVTSTITVGHRPLDVVVSPDGTRAYVTNRDDNTVSVIDTNQATTIATIPVGATPLGVAINPAGTRVYVANSASDSVSVIETAPNPDGSYNVSTITGFQDPLGLAVSPDGQTLFVTNGDTGTVSVVDTETNAVVEPPIVVGIGPSNVAFTPDGTRAYVTNSASNTVSSIDITTNPDGTATYTVSTIGGFRKPIGLGVSPDGSVAYVTNYNNASVSLIDTGTNTVIDADPATPWNNAVRAVDQPIGLAVRPDGNAVYVVGAPAYAAVLSPQPYHAAPVAGNDTVNTAEDTPVSGNVLANDNDPEGRALSVYTYTNPSHGTLILAPNGSFTYTPAPNYNGFDNFTYTATDGIKTSNTAVVMINIAPVNDAPVVGSPAYTVGTANPTTGVVTGSLKVSDPEGDALTYVVTGPATQGKATVNSDGSFTYDPTDASRLRAGLSPGVDYDNFTVTVTDTHGAANTVPVSVTIAPTKVTIAATVTVGAQPMSVAVSPTAPVAFVANSADGTVTEIDTSSNSVVDGPVTVGTNPSGVVYTPDGTFAYIANAGSGSVTAIKTATLGTQSVVVGGIPRAVAITPDGAYAYVANANGTVNVIKTSTNSVVGSPITVGGNPRDIAIATTPLGTYAYVADEGGTTVKAINTATGAVTFIPVGSPTFGVAITPDGSRAYVTNYYTNTVTVINTATNTVSGSIPSVSSPWDVALSPNGEVAYVTNMSADTVTVIDTATNTVITTIAVGHTPRGVAVSPDGTHVYVTNWNGTTTSVLAIVPTGP